MTWMRPRLFVRRAIAVIAAYALAAQAMVVALAVPAVDADPASLCLSADAPNQSGANSSPPLHAPASDHSDCNACTIACSATPALARGEETVEFVAPAHRAMEVPWPTVAPWRPAIPRAGLARAPPVAV